MQSVEDYIFLSAIFNADRTKTIKNAITTGVKTSSQPIPPVIILIMKSIILNSVPNEITIFLRLVWLAVVFFVFLFATIAIFLIIY